MGTISLGDSISDSSEKLLQRGRRGRGKVHIWRILVKGKYVQSSIYYFLQKISACLETDVTGRILVHFRYEEMQGGLISHLLSISNYLKTDSAHFPRAPHSCYPP